MKNQRTLIILCSAALVGIFLISFSLTLNKLYYSNFNANKDNELGDKSHYVSYFDEEEVLPLDTTVTSYLKLENNGEEFNLKSVKLKDFALAQSGKMSLKDLEQYFNSINYRLSRKNEDEVVFIKTIEYEPNKYFLGPTEDGYVGLFKSDEEGNLSQIDLSDEVTLKRLDALPNNDRILINNYQFKFDNYQEALEEISSISS